MKKLLLLIAGSIFSISTFAQQADSLGVDNSPLLNAQESAFFNKRFEKERGDFDFAGKKAAFISGGNAGTPSDKISYFSDVKEWREKHDRDISSYVIFLSDDERKLCGYDVFVTRWSMVLMSTKKKARHIERLIKENSK